MNKSSALYTERICCQLGEMLREVAMKRSLVLLIALACSAISANAVFACQCDEYGTPVCARYWRADAVFVGQVREITRPDNPLRSVPTATLHFIVEQPFRGISTATVDVETLSGTSCDMPLKKGQRYLVYAVRGGESKELFAGPCMGTTELSGADDDLNYIRSLTQQLATESIVGKVTHSKYDPLQGIKIEVRNENKTLETKTDDEGRFEVSVPGPGMYLVRVMIPSSVGVMSRRDDPIRTIEETDTLTTIEYEVELEKSHCDYRQLQTFPVDLHATAEISGSVLTRSGRPVDKGYVRLMKVDSESWDYQQIAADGSFKFEGVAVGEYFLALNPRNEAPDDSDAPYPRAFYPNASDASGATKIVVTEGAKLENLVLRVGPAFKAKKVSGKVVWFDGSPVVKGTVSVYDGDRYIRMISVDKNGMFAFEVYGEFNYVICAEVLGERWGKSERVPIADKSTNLKLVLKPK